MEQNLSLIAVCALLAMAGLRAAAARGLREAADGGDGGPCFSQLQMLATHNSYHVAPNKAIMKLLGSELAQSLLPPSLNLPQSLEYASPPLAQQLQEGVRSLELDVHADPEGGRYGQSAVLRLAGESGVLDAPQLQEPGFKVFHLPDIDYNSTCWLLTDCLTEIKRWSDANPGHLPLTIFVEAKEQGDIATALGPAAVAAIEALLASSDQPGPSSLTPPLELNATLFADLEDEILSVMGDAALTPDSLLAPSGAQNLTDLLLVPPETGTCPWPELDTMRGKFLFVLILNSEEQAAAYEELHPGGEGALLWRMASAGDEQPEAVFYSSGLSLDAATAEAAGVPPGQLPSNLSAYIESWVEETRDKVGQGYIVRARVDQDTVEARHNSTARRDALLATGAQLIMTDYPHRPSSLFPSSYEVSIPGGRPARCVNGGRGSTADDVACG